MGTRSPVGERVRVLCAQFLHDSVEERLVLGDGVYVLADRLCCIGEPTDGVVSERELILKLVGFDVLPGGDLRLHLVSIDGDPLG